MKKRTIISSITLGVASLLAVGGIISFGASKKAEVKETKADDVISYMGWDEDASELVPMQVSRSEVTSLTTSIRELGVADETTWYILDSNINVEIGSDKYTVSGTVNVIVADGFTWTATADTFNIMGLTLDSSFNVYGQALGTGSLNFTSNNNSPIAGNATSFEDMFKMSVYGGNHYLTGYICALGNMYLDVYGGVTRTESTGNIFGALQRNARIFGGELYAKSSKSTIPATSQSIFGGDGFDPVVYRSDDGFSWTKVALDDSGRTSEWQIKIVAKVHLDGEGTSSDPYRLDSKKSLMAFRDVVNSEDSEACAKLVADIDLENEPWTPFDEFCGILDGDRHTISGLNVNGSYGNAGFIEAIFVGGEVVKLTLEGTVTNTKDDGSPYTGGFAGYSIGDIEDCINKVNVEGYCYAGGFVGYNEGTIKKCYNEGTVETTDGNNAGGIAAFNSDGGQINNCYNLGSIRSEGNYAGGIVGTNNLGIIAHTFNKGDISCEGDYCGAIVGSAEDGLTSNFFLGNEWIEGIGRDEGVPKKPVELTSDDFKDQATFSDWDFNEVWGMGSDHPVFVKGYGLWVGGDFVSDFQTSGEGWSYDPDLNVLTLNNFTYTGKGQTVVSESEGNIKAAISSTTGESFTIVLVGENTITLNPYASSWNSAAIYCDADIGFNGQGSLVVVNSDDKDKVKNSYGVCAIGDIMFNDASVDITAGQVNSGKGSVGAYSVKGDIYVHAGIEKVVACGDTYAFFAGGSDGTGDYGTIYGIYEGTGWTDKAGETTGTLIEKNQYYSNSDFETYKKVEFVGKTPAEIVVDLINAIGEVTYPTSGSKISSARNAYNALSEAEKVQVTNYNVLVAAEAEYAYLKAPYDVKDLIDAIGEVEDSEECREKIEEARFAYDELDQNQKQEVSNLETLEEAERQYAYLHAPIVVEGLINAIGVVTYTSEVKAKIDAASNAYSSLDETQKAQVSNVDVLEAALAEWALLAHQDEMTDNGVHVSGKDGDLIPNNVTLKVELSTSVKAEEGSEEFGNISNLLGSDKEITAVYDVKLIKTEGGVETEIQPSDIKEGFVLVIEITLPDGMSVEGLEVLHIHSDSDVGFITNFTIQNGKLTFEVSKLSEIAFVMPVSKAGPSARAGLPGWAIALIIIAVVLLALCGAYFLLLFVFNKWINEEGEAVRVLPFSLGKKDGKERLLAFPFDVFYRDAKEVFKTKDEALKK